MRMTTDTLYNAGCGDAPAPGGIPRARLAWLCQPEQIERTLRLLSSLNHWAKARERLLYADRQGLYRVKAALVQQAFAAGLISPVSYTDGSAALDLFARITGRRPACRADIEALDVEGTKTFLQERPAALVTQARATRLPIPDGDRPSPRWCELGVDIAAVCPHRLIEKQEYVSRLVRRYPYWDGDGDDDDEEDGWDDESWEVLSRRPDHRHEGGRAPGACPLCGGAVEPDLLLRIAHWRQDHREQDLTAGQTAWLLGKRKSEVKSPSAAIQPDYRGPSPSQQGKGTRFWRLETLEIAVKQNRGRAGES